MIEKLTTAKLEEQIKSIIKLKQWYFLTESSRFLWQESVDLMAKMLGEIGYITSEQLQEIIESSFTPDSLSLAGDNFFIDSLLKIDPKLIIWTEGDGDWQELKVFRTRLIDRPGIEAHFISKNKVSKLESIISSIVNESEEDVTIIVIDDKEKNILYVKDLKNRMDSNSTTIDTYQLNLKDIKFNPDACLLFLSEISERNIRLIVDMDGVLIDTDSVLSNVVSKKLAEFFCHK